MIAGSAPSTPEQQARVRRLVMTMALGESPLLIGGVVAYLLTGNWIYLGIGIAGGVMIGLIAIVRFTVQTQRAAESDLSVTSNDSPSNPPIVE